MMPAPVSRNLGHTYWIQKKEVIDLSVGIDSSLSSSAPDLAGSSGHNGLWRELRPYPYPHEL